MKVGFFHDARLYKGEDKQMYSIGFSYTLWERYLEVFDEMVICTREADEIINDYSNYKVSSGKNVSFKLNKAYKNPMQILTKPKNVIQPISDVIKDVDACIIRLPSVIGILAVRECIKQNKPWAIEVVACTWDSLWNYGNIKGKLFAPIMYIMNKLYIKKASYALYVSKQFLQRRYPCKGINAGVSDVNIEKVEKDIIDKRLQKIDNIKSTDTITLGLIGSLNVEYKGHRYAIKAIKELKDNGYNVVLKCLGGGTKDKWEELSRNLGVSDRVEFCGILQSGKPVLDWIDNIDIFVMPSLQEGLPRSMVEAMSRGCNVIGSRTGGIPELIEDSFIFDAKDYKKLSELVIGIINNKELSKKQSIRNSLEASKYIKTNLEKERLAFWNKFKHSI